MHVAVTHAQMWACMHHGTSAHMQASTRNAVDGPKCSNGTEINSIIWYCDLYVRYNGTALGLQLSVFKSRTK